MGVEYIYHGRIELAAKATPALAWVGGQIPKLNLSLAIPVLVTYCWRLLLEATAGG